MNPEKLIRDALNEIIKIVLESPDEDFLSIKTDGDAAKLVVAPVFKVIHAIAREYSIDEFTQILMKNYEVYEEYQRKLEMAVKKRLNNIDDSKFELTEISARSSAG